MLYACAPKFDVTEILKSFLFLDELAYVSSSSQKLGSQNGVEEERPWERSFGSLPAPAAAGRASGQRRDASP